MWVIIKKEPFYEKGPFLLAKKTLLDDEGFDKEVPLSSSCKLCITEIIE